MPPQEFGGGHIELQLLPLYLDHTARHIWDEEVKLVWFILLNYVYYYITSFLHKFIFLQDHDPLKFINYERKITDFPQSNDKWFQVALSLSEMKDLCKTDYVTVNHRKFNAFVERWNTETPSFHLPLGEMSITLEDVSCLLHLSIRGKLLDHGRIRKDEALKIMIEYLGVDLENAMVEFEKTRGAHARFEFLKKVCINELLRSE